MTADGPRQPKLTPEALAALQRAKQPSGTLRQKSITDVVSQWRGGGGGNTGSPEWRGLAPSTRKTWNSHADAIEHRWGKFPLSIWNEPRMVSKVVSWRDSRASTPRAADIGITVLRTILEFARLRGLLSINVASGVPHLYRGGSRAEIIWTDEDIARFTAAANGESSGHIADGLRLAELTGLRRQDLVTLTWNQVGDVAIMKKALKTSRHKRRHVTIPIVSGLRELLRELRTRERADGVETVLVNSYGRSWSGDGFGGSFNRIRDLADIAHVDPETGARRMKHLHDVRGTFCTKLILAGTTNQEAAEVMGWSPDQVAGIRRVYVDQSPVIVALGKRIATGAL